MQPMMSWEEFFHLSILLLFLYYTAIILLFYRKGFPGAFKRPGRRGWKPSGDPVTEMDKRQAADKSLSPAAYELMEELKKVFTAAVKDQLTRGQVLEAIALRLQKYPAIPGTVLQVALESYIAAELENQCNMEVSAAELKTLWYP